jgi:hypothetical protein
VNRTEGSNCTSCTLYQDTAGSEVDADPLFVGKHAIVNGWRTPHLKRQRQTKTNRSADRQ